MSINMMKILHESVQSSEFQSQIVSEYFKIDCVSNFKLSRNSTTRWTLKKCVKLKLYSSYNWLGLSENEMSIDMMKILHDSDLSEFEQSQIVASRKNNWSNTDTVVAGFLRNWGKKITRITKYNENCCCNMTKQRLYFNLQMFLLPSSYGFKSERRLSSLNIHRDLNFVIEVRFHEVTQFFKRSLGSRISTRFRIRHVVDFNVIRNIQQETATCTSPTRFYTNTAIATHTNPLKFISNPLIDFPSYVRIRTHAQAHVLHRTVVRFVHSFSTRL